MQFHEGRLGCGTLVLLVLGVILGVAAWLVLTSYFSIPYSN